MGDRPKVDAQSEIRPTCKHNPDFCSGTHACSMRPLCELIDRLLPVHTNRKRSVDG